jgi:hypothetical protein
MSNGLQAAAAAGVRFTVSRKIQAGTPQASEDERLEGLFIPSESQWIRGATRIRAAPLQRQSLPRDRKITREILLAEERVHQLADRAIKAGGWSERGEIYAEVLSTCANCHSLHKVWGPRKSPAW